MIARIHDDILLCDACAPRVNLMLQAKMVGPDSPFENACPHIELVFLDWHKLLREKEGARFKDVWQPFCIGLLLGAAIVGSFTWGLA